MSRCERVEFRVRLGKPEDPSAAEVQLAATKSMADVQQAVTTAFAQERAASS
jgi:hypothetical protein